MSELITSTRVSRDLRWHLLATVSAMALTANAMPAAAQDENRPTVWVELGAQYEEVTGGDDPFLPPFDADAKAAGLPSITEITNILGKTFGGEGSLSFQPHGSDWIFNVSARYGRTQNVRHGHGQQIIVGPPLGQYLTPGGSHLKNGLGTKVLVTQTAAGYADQTINNSETHTIVDFQVGKDVGLGLFGRGTDSVVSVGARYAQINAASKARSDIVYHVSFSRRKISGAKYAIYETHYNSAATIQRNSDLHAVGPSISLNNSTGVLGSREDGELFVDWGMNAAVLFGRQKAEVHHQSTIRKFGGQGGTPYVLRNTMHYSGPVQGTRTRNVVVPNIGGFAAISYRFPRAKLSAGYRADFFFGAMDRGLDAHDSVTTGFHGPFAIISFGLGG